MTATFKLLTDYQEEISKHLNAGHIHLAKETFLDALSIYPTSCDLLILGSNIYRILNDFDSAINSAKNLVKYHPSFFDGYCRAAQDLSLLNRHEEAVDIISVGLSFFPDDQWILFTGLLVYTASKDYQSAAEVGSKLYGAHPDFYDFYTIYIDSLYQLGNYDHADEVIEAFYSRFPNEFPAVQLKLDLLFKQREHLEYRSMLYRLALAMPSHRAEFLNRIHRFEHLCSYRVSTPRNMHGCDVCCVASDEGPYIAEFIHHYLYLGFANIFVGINNSSDQTDEILKTISSAHPNVHVLDVNQSQSTFHQGGCYRVLFNYARQVSTSKYCLIVDVDEFWVVDPFPKSVGQFLEERPSFDVYSFHWIRCSGESLFSPPLSPVQAYAWDVHLKSMCSYDSEYLDIYNHAPGLQHSRDLCVIRGTSTNASMTVLPAGIRIPQISNDYESSPIGGSGLGWILHRILRSELEYSFRVFKKHSNSRHDDYFKDNRWGYLVDAHNPECATYFQHVLPAQEVSQYHRSLDAFLQDLSLNDLLSAARSVISEENIYEKLNNIPPEIIQRDRNLVRNLFNCTRFDDWVSNNT